MYNQLLSQLQPYPFERLARLLAGVSEEERQKTGLSLVNLSIGEPKHATPAVITDAITANLNGLSSYPGTAGTPSLRRAIADWLKNRYGLKDLDYSKHVLPVLGSREALFSLAQVVIDKGKSTAQPIVLAPNPFYQIYEGAALLAGAEPFYLPQSAASGFAIDWEAIPSEILQRTQLLYVCSPGNPTGKVMPLQEWKRVFELADLYGFVIASDECYSEIWYSEAPLGALQAAQLLGRNWDRLISFTSLSKRSNAPGLRSGFVAGDPLLLSKFLLYRTYHGSAMSMMVQKASEAAWCDETHVQANRRLYAQKYQLTESTLNQATGARAPEAGFYYWFAVPQGCAKNADAGLTDDEFFVRELYRRSNVLTLPGHYLSRSDSTGVSPGQGWVRLALVEPAESCVEGINRIAEFCSQLRLFPQS